MEGSEEEKVQKINSICKLGKEVHCTLLHSCSPNTLGGQGRRIASAKEFQTSLGNGDIISTKKV